MRRVVPRARRQLAALVGNWVLQALIVRLRQDRRHRNVARVRSQHGQPTRVESAKDLRGGEGPFQRVEARLRLRGPREPNRAVGLPSAVSGAASSA